MIRRNALHVIPIALVMLAVNACQPVSAASAALSPPRLDISAPAEHGTQVAVLAGGCFWGIEAVFEHVKGVRKVVAGYAGGSADSANYGDVSSGRTGHAESVRIEFDPSQVSYGQLLQVFFSVALDPTEKNRQGPDVGSQYRSVIFHVDAQQQRVASAYIAQLTAEKSFPAPIVTEVVPLQAFYPAETWHQDYFRLHPHNLYIVYNDAPKVARLQHLFPALYKEDRRIANVGARPPA